MDPIVATEQPGVLRLSWDYRVVPKRFHFWFRVVWCVVWIIASLVATIAAILEVIEAQWCGFSFLVCWSMFAWYVSMASLQSLFWSGWVERLEVSAKGVAVACTGTWAPKPRSWPLHKIREIALGWYHDGWSVDTGVSLWIVREEAGISWKIGFADLLIDDLKRDVFEKIRMFVEANNLPLKLTVFGNPDEGRNAGKSGNASDGP